MRGARLSRLKPPALFLALAFALYGRMWAQPGRRLPGRNIHDAQLDVWMLGWLEHCLAHGIDPFITHTLNAPAGINLAWNTSLPLPGLVLSPVTALWGPSVAALLLLTLCPALSATSLWWVLTRLGVRSPAAAAGGLLYGFGPALLSQSLGHANLGFDVFPPLILLAALRLWQGADPKRGGLLLGLACAGQLYVGEEMLLISVLFGVVLLLVLLPGHRAELHERWKRVLLGSAIGAGSALLLCAWPLLDQFYGPQQLKGQIYPEELYSADLHGLVTTTPLQLLHAHRDVAQLAKFTDDLSEPTGYLGLPLLLLAIGGLIALRKDLRIRTALVMATIATVFSMGDVIHRGGKPTPANGPWHLLSGYPILENVLPARLAIFTTLFLGAAVAFALDRAWSDGPPWRVAAPVCVVFAFIPLIPSLTTPASFSTPAFFTDGAAGRLAHGHGLLVLPYPSPGVTEPMVWQAEAGMSFTMPGGYFLGPDPSNGKPYVGGFQRPSSSWFTDVTVHGTVAPADASRRQQLATDLQAWDTTAIVLGPCPEHDLLLGLVTEIVGRAPVEQDGVDVWTGVTPGSALG
ncbi:MAG TPA: hypothetical protein VHE83_09715 [Mycobacteriales bacterium]|nr:hypothetical protein [Mycobacteriales bacterium]